MMLEYKNNSSGIYEGYEPYLFISYSHKDAYALERVKTIFDDSKLRYWYDNGLHSGDDWNLIIAKRLQNASVCLLLLSPNSASSEYVKNELNFAMNHRIPIHTLLLSSFELPPDIEMMTGRIQMVQMQGDYAPKLLKPIPAEIYYSHSDDPGTPVVHKHPLFQLEEELCERQGTKIYHGRHSRLNYKCLIQQDPLKASDLYDANALSVLACSISHPVFPKIIDVEISNGQMWTYQAYWDQEFLDRYLETNQPSEETILQWTLAVIDGLEYLFKRNLALRDLSRGSIVVVNGEAIGISRLQNMYYGLIKLQVETRPYYFEQELQEIAILLAQLCSGKTPALPLRMIKEKRFSKRFLDAVNLVIQKCVKENGKAQYTDFSQIKTDLLSSKLSLKDRMFLSERSKKLDKYDAVKAVRSQQFTSSKPLPPSSTQPKFAPVHASLEEEFGFERTVVLSTQSDEPIAEENKGTPTMQILVCSTGQILDFFKDTIMIGKGPGCDLAWTQPFVSRSHARLRKISADTYNVMDMGSSNGTYIFRTEQQSERLTAHVPTEIPAGTIIVIADVQIKVL